MSLRNKCGDFSQNLKGNRILNVKLTNFHPESRGMTIFSKSPCQEATAAANSGLPADCSNDMADGNQKLQNIVTLRIT